MNKKLFFFTIFVLLSFWAISQNQELFSHHKSIIESRNLSLLIQHSDTFSEHELTLFILNPSSPLDWESPSALYKTVRKSYIKTLFQPLRNPLGHMAFCLETSLLSSPLWMGITKKKMSLQNHVNLIKKLGLGVLAYPFYSNLEDKSIIETYLNFNVKKNQVRVLTFQINEESAHRILDFLTAFLNENSLGYVSGNYYGGIFWPLYEGEGAGCSALCMSVLEVAGIDMEDKEAWKIEVGIPMDLVGEEQKPIEGSILTKVKKADSWHEKNGIPNEDYVPFEIYAPDLIFDWINEKMKTEPHYIYTLNKKEIPGLYFDYTDIVLPQEPFLSLEKRPGYSFFLKDFKP